MSEVKRVLQVVTIMNRGGAETMIMSHYRKIDRTKLQFDFMVNRQERGAFDDEIERMGGRIYRLCAIRPWTYLRYFRELDAFFKEHAQDYVAVHSHIQENSGFVFKYAQRYGLMNCIANSHIDFKGWDSKILFRKFAAIYLHKYSTKNIACGESAGKYLFGERPFEVFKNAIDVSRFSYQPEIRERLRKELGIAGRIVLGSVARITWQKNHTFMIDMMEMMHKLHPEVLLLLIGTGEKAEEIRQKIKEKRLEDCVWMLGSKPNVNEYLQAFDVFFMPSLFEGLPVSVIEAQAAGVPCVLSDTIDQETDVTGLVTFVPLYAGMDVWCDSVLRAAATPRADTREAIANAGYDVDLNVLRLLEYYGV